MQAAAQASDDSSGSGSTDATQASTMRVVSLNIRHGGGRRLGRILKAIEALNADVLLLTEYRRNQNAPRLAEALARLDYEQQLSPASESGENSVLLASKLPLSQRLEADLPSAFAHRLVCGNFPRFTLVGAYFPQAEAKRPVFEYLTMSLLPRLGPATMLIGDLNTGKPLLDEKGETFACVDAFSQLEVIGFVDAWRSRNPGRREFSWYSSGNNGFRIDHAFCTNALNLRVKSIEYVHSTRARDVTDHSALLVDISI